jgi:hypothetical protein
MAAFTLAVRQFTEQPTNILHDEQSVTKCFKCVEEAVGFIDAFQIYPNMYQQVIVIITGS